MNEKSESGGLLKIIFLSLKSIQNVKFTEAWFKLLGWATLIAALHAIGERADSIVIQSVAIFSACVYFLYVMHILDEVVRPLLAESMKKSIAAEIVALLVVLVLQISFIIFLNRVINTVLGSGDA